jgi:hypothetical protein
MRTISIGTMIKSIGGMVGTNDLSAWENEFVQNIVEVSQNGKVTTNLTDKQVDRVEDIYRKHFA